MYQPVVYYQTDPRWRNIPYAAKGENSTIGSAGCGPSSMAMVLATWVDKNVTPKTECAWSLANGYKCLNGGTYYSYIPPAAQRYGLNAYRLNYSNIYGNSTSDYHAQAKKLIEAGHLIIACMGKGTWTSSGHYILVYNIEGNTIYINDPYSSAAKRTRGDYSVFKKQVKYYFAIENPYIKPTKVGKKVDYKVKVNDADGLNCRIGPNTELKKVKTYAKNAILHITVEHEGWGYTGEGWVNLGHTTKLNKGDVEAMTKQEFINKLTNEEAYTLVKKAMTYAASIPEPDWSKKEGGMAAAKKHGVIKDGEPERFVKRDEVIAMMYRLGLFK